MNPVLNPLTHGIIVSVQADEGEPLNSPQHLGALAQSALAGGACGLRLANPENIRYIKTLLPNIPIIGITKPQKIPSNYRDHVYITPTWQDLVSIQAAGADIIALDGTSRPRPHGETLKSIVESARKNYPGLLLMADISTLEEGLKAQSLGFDLISTTLSGYTTETETLIKNGEPDFALLDQLVRQSRLPVIMEGRIWTPEHVRKAFSLKAYAVVIGSAITRPQLITRRFVDASG